MSFHSTETRNPRSEEDIFEQILLRLEVSTLQRKLLFIYHLLSGANSAAEPHPSLRGNFLMGVVHKASLHMTAILSVPVFSGKAGLWTQNHRKPVTSQVQPDL